MLEITAVYQRERFRFPNADGDAVIAEARIVNGSVGDHVTIKGKAEPQELQANLTYRFYGRWSSYRNKRTGMEERQFAFQTFVQSQPHGRAGVITYLKKAGEGRGLGQVRATKVWERFGADSVRIFREHPDVVAAAISGLRPQQALEIAEVLRERQALEDCTIELTSLLDGRGFPKATAGLAIRRWGNEAADIIKRDPYRLLDFRGCGFRRCDSLYQELGLPPARLRRQAYCGWYTIASDSDGHTWYPAQFAADGVGSLIGGTAARPAAAIKMCRRIGTMIGSGANGALAVIREAGGAIVDAGTNVYVAEANKAEAEQRIARLVAERLYFGTGKHSVFWPDAGDLRDISDHQRETLRQCLQGSVCILGGSPGTGKTYTAARVIAAIGDRIGYERIAVAAPTGKAAVRITHAMRDYGIPLEARTWHSLLGMGAGGGFRHNASNPWEYDLIIGDESSMIDTSLMSSILDATPVGCRVMLIGDVNQLPPVGHGAPLRDLIAAQVPSAELRDIQRSSGGIVEACAAIRDGQPWDGGDNLHVVPSAAADAIQRLEEQLDAAARDGFDRIWDCQVLVAVNERSPLARKTLNQTLQGLLNPNAPVKGSAYRVGDKVVCMANGSYSLIRSGKRDADEGEQVRVMNGELGRVIEIAPRYMIIQVDSPDRVVRVPIGDGGTSSWDLGYALSCHKSQGSEWPVVIVMIDEYPGARMVCSREWLYTAISRAKQRCVLIGRKAVADQMCGRVSIGKRKTFLREQIMRHLATLHLADM